MEKNHELYLPKPNHNFESISSLALDRLRDYAELVRNMSRQQKEEWRLVPYWALMADGVDGYSDQRSAAYCDGLWRLDASLNRSNYYQAAIDLDNGEIVSLFNPEHQAADSVVLSLASPETITQLDANRVLESLIYEGTSPAKSYASKSQQELDIWHTEMLERLNLGRVYQRKLTVTAEEISLRAAQSIASDAAGIY